MLKHLNPEINYIVVNPLQSTFLAYSDYNFLHLGPMVFILDKISLTKASHVRI